jgi:hypothetical protein
MINSFLRINSRLRRAGAFNVSLADPCYPYNCDANGRYCLSLYLGD